MLWHNAHQNREWRDLPLQVSVAADSPVSLIQYEQLQVYTHQLLAGCQLEKSSEGVSPVLFDKSAQARLH